MKILPFGAPAANLHLNLGINAKSASGPENNDLEAQSTGGADSVDNFSAARPVSDLSERRRLEENRQRWRLQRAAQGLLQADRVSMCQRGVAAGAVGVQRDAETGCTHFSGIVTCGSVWHCPICADKITGERRRELQDAIAAWLGQGGAVYLLTFTFRHDLSLPLQDGLDRMQEAQRKMKGRRAYKAIMDAAGAVGSIKALEVTYGENGWHPHVHMLVLGKPDRLDDLQGVRGIWADVVFKCGLGRVNEHGFDVRGGDYAAEYVAKYGKEPSAVSRAALNSWWTTSHELTRGHMKAGQRMAGATPFTLLRWFLDNGDTHAGALFAEYAGIFKGRRQLFYSPGLKEKLDLFALERTRKEKEKPSLVMRLDWDDWSAILRHEARWHVLYIAERYGAEAVRELVDQMLASKGRYRGFFKIADPMTGSMTNFFTHEAKAA